MLNSFAVRQALNDRRFVEQTVERDLTDIEKYGMLVESMEDMQGQLECEYFPRHRVQAARLAEQGDVEAICRFLIASRDEDDDAHRATMRG